MNKFEKPLIPNTTNEKIENDKHPFLNNEKVLLNIPVNISVELGRVKLTVQDFLNLSQGGLLILNKLIQEPVDIFVNGTLIASGEIVMLDEKYGIRILHIKNSIKSI